MPSNKENSTKSRFHIKLLAGNNVVLIEADDYESEIFTPHIVNGRIAFQNIIPNRRCCKTSENNSLNQQSQGAKTKMFRYSEDQSAFLMPKPLANSTPANTKQRNSCGQSYNKNYGFSSHASSKNSTLLTPEPVRRAVTQMPNVLEKSLLNLPKGIREARIYSSTDNRTPKKLCRLSGSALNTSRIFQSPAISRLNGSFSLTTSTVKSITAGNMGSITKWRKVLTPVRTYTKNSKQPVMLQRPMKVASVTKFNKPCKVTPTYLVNATQGPNVSRCIEIKKRKLIIDAKLCISPKTFKRQQNEKYGNCQIKVKPLALPKSRRYNYIWAMSAFDLLTNSNRSCCLSSKLNMQFRKGCVNKASSTYVKYKILSTIPPLQQDEQVLEISRLSMQADQMFQKRMII